VALLGKKSRSDDPKGDSIAKYPQREKGGQEKDKVRQARERKTG